MILTACRPGVQLDLEEVRAGEGVDGLWVEGESLAQGGDIFEDEELRSEEVAVAEVSRDQAVLEVDVFPILKLFKREKPWQGGPPTNKSTSPFLGIPSASDPSQACFRRPLHS